MSRLLVPLAAASLALLATCNGEDDKNPARLYLALLDSELTVRLSPREPDPF